MIKTQEMADRGRSPGWDSAMSTPPWSGHPSLRVVRDVPRVDACAAMACGYNVDNRCHATAITVGGETTPLCLTFLPGGEHYVEDPGRAAVGACELTRCHYNDRKSCRAASVQMACTQRVPGCLAARL